jgi:hypothetical protein
MTDPLEEEPVDLGDLDVVSSGSAKVDSTEKIDSLLGSFADDEISSPHGSNQSIRRSANIELERFALENRHKRDMAKEAAAKNFGYGVIVTFMFAVGFLLVWGAWASADSDATKLDRVIEMGEFLFPYLATPIGFVLGYYFSGRNSGQ